MKWQSNGEAEEIVMCIYRFKNVFLIVIFQEHLEDNEILHASCDLDEAVETHA